VRVEQIFILPKKREGLACKAKRSWTKLAIIIALPKIVLFLQQKPVFTFPDENRLRWLRHRMSFSWSIKPRPVRFSRSANLQVFEAAATSRSHARLQHTSLWFFFPGG
jgi:hypothetical protein